MSRAHNRKQSVHSQQSQELNTNQLVTRLQLALAEAIQQNQTLRNRVIELQALLVASQQMKEEVFTRSRQKPERIQPPRHSKKKIQYRNMKKY